MVIDLVSTSVATEILLGETDLGLAMVGGGWEAAIYSFAYWMSENSNDVHYTFMLVQADSWEKMQKKTNWSPHYFF